MLKTVIKTGLALPLFIPAVAVAQLSDVDTVIESYITQGSYVSATSPCSERALNRKGQSLSQYMRKKTNGIASQVNRGDGYMSVGGKINVALDAVSFCYKEAGRPIEDKANIAGDMARLLVYRLQGKRDFGVNAVDLANAKTLAQFAKSNGTDMSFEEQALAQFQAPKAAPVTGAVSNELNFNDIAKEFESNSLRVKKKYADKQVIGSGKIEEVRFIEKSPLSQTSKDRIIIYFDGPKTYLNGSSGDLETATFIRCEIEMGTPSEDKAIELDKGDSVKVSGLFEMDKFGRMPPTIKQCEIL